MVAGGRLPRGGVRGRPALRELAAAPAAPADSGDAAHRAGGTAGAADVGRVGGRGLAVLVDGGRVDAGTLIAGTAVVVALAGYGRVGPALLRWRGVAVRPAPVALVALGAAYSM